LLEAIESFDQKSMKTKIMTVMNQGTKELKEMLFDKILSEDIPDSWKTLKKSVIEFCVCQYIDSVVKYKEEPGVGILPD
jgi:hypothetical protein